MKKRKKVKTKRGFILRPIHFILLIIINACLLAGVIIPQRSKINEAQELLEAKRRERLEYEIEYQRQLESLNYMKTEAYQLQQGYEKYGYHFEGDTLIYDTFVSPSPSPSGTMPVATPAPTIVSSPTPRVHLVGSAQPSASNPGNTPSGSSSPSGSPDASASAAPAESPVSESPDSSPSPSGDSYIAATPAPGQP